MSLDVGEMKSLQTLSKISIGGEKDFPTSVLWNLNNLRHQVCIDGLEKLQNIDQARKLNLSQMRLSELVVEWSDDFDGSRNQRLETEVQVLDELKPHTANLKKIKVVSYWGTKFPKWVGDSSFRKLNVVHMSKCRNCLSLPPLGQLPSLKHLKIDNMDDVKEVGLGLFGNESPAFRSLTNLFFSHMPRWEEWSVDAVFPRLEFLHIEDCPNMKRWKANARVTVFPRLEKLVVIQCPNLVEVSLEALPSLRDLLISVCGDGVLKSLVGVASVVNKLSIWGISRLSDEVWAVVVQSLKALEELTIWSCKEIRNLWESEEEEVDACKEVLVNLKKLKIGFCDELVGIGGGRGGEKEDEEGSNLPTSRVTCFLQQLITLEIVNCEKIESFLDLKDLVSLKHLEIKFCEKIESFPDLKHLVSLKHLEIKYCEKIESFPDLKDLVSLKHLEIESCGGIESFPDLKDLVSLKHLEIKYCKKIESFPDLKYLVSLKHLKICNCANMDGPPLLGSGVWPPNLDSLYIGVLKRPISKWGPLPTSVVELTLLGGFDDVKSFPTSLLPYSKSSSLNRLILIQFRKMERISSEGLQHLTSLQHLEIKFCPRLKHLPESLLPSLLSLTVSSGCDEQLKQKMMSRRGSYWPLLSDVPRVYIRSLHPPLVSKLRRILLAPSL